jgi:hypothetical protein
MQIYPFYIVTLVIAMLGWLLLVIGGTSWEFRGSFWFFIFLDAVVIAATTFFQFIYANGFTQYRGVLLAFTVITTVGFMSSASSVGVLMGGAILRLMVNFIWLLVWGSADSTFIGQIASTKYGGLPSVPNTQATESTEQV